MIDPIQIAIGFLVVVIAVGALLFVFYSRTNAVEKTGYGTLIMLAIVSLMIPIFWKKLNSMPPPCSVVSCFTQHIVISVMEPGGRVILARG